jgi:hypothetical protein
VLRFDNCISGDCEGEVAVLAAGRERRVRLVVVVVAGWVRGEDYASSEPQSILRQWCNADDCTSLQIHVQP